MLNKSQEEKEIYSKRIEDLKNDDLLSVMKRNNSSITPQVNSWLTHPEPEINYEYIEEMRKEQIQDEKREIWRYWGGIVISNLITCLATLYSVNYKEINQMLISFFSN